VKRLNGVTALLLSLAFLVSAANCALLFFVHIPVNERLRPRTYFQAYGVAELFLAAVGLVLATLVAFLLHRRSMNDEQKAGRVALGVSVAALVVGVIGLPHYMLLVGIFLIGACLSFSARQSRVLGTELPPVSRSATSSR
jgi:Na+/melibiose symporter-like transporter